MNQAGAYRSWKRSVKGKTAMTIANQVFGHVNASKTFQGSLWNKKKYWMINDLAKLSVIQRQYQMFKFKDMVNKIHVCCWLNQLECINVDTSCCQLKLFLSLLKRY